MYKNKRSATIFSILKSVSMVIAVCCYSLLTMKSLSSHQFRKLLRLRQAHSTAYVINPYLRAEEQEKQSLYLTKTVKKDGLPSCYGKDTEGLRTRNTIPDSEKDLLVNSIMNSIISTNYFHRDGELKVPKRWREARKQRKMDEFKSELSFQVLSNMLKIIWTSKYARVAGLLDKNISFRPDLQAPWKRFDKNLQVSGKLGHLLYGKSLLPAFSTGDEVENSRNIPLSWDDVISPFFDLHEVATSMEAKCGFYNDSPFPCPQTLFLMNDPYWFSRMNTGQGVFYSFAHALTYALSNGAKMGEDLDQPVPIQCLVFNGSSFYIVCYQLNTLNFDVNNNNIKNFTWILPDQFLYEKVHDKKSDCLDYTDFTSKRVSLMDYDRKVLTETFDNVQTKRVYIEGFEKNTVRLFIDLMLHPL